MMAAHRRAAAGASDSDFAMYASRYRIICRRVLYAIDAAPQRRWRLSLAVSMPDVRHAGVVVMSHQAGASIR